MPRTPPYTKEQKEYIRENYNNPADGTMFRDQLRTKFNREMTQSMIPFQNENKKLFGEVAIKHHIDAGLQRTPRIEMGKLYVIEPFLLANGEMSREQTIYLRDATDGAKTRYLTIGQLKKKDVT